MELQLRLGVGLQNTTRDLSGAQSSAQTTASSGESDEHLVVGDRLSGDVSRLRQKLTEHLGTPTPTLNGLK